MHIEFIKGSKIDNEINCGISVNNYGGQTTFIAVTYSESKTFKTESGAEKWLNKMGFERVGIKHATHLKIEKRVNEVLGAI